MPDPIARGLSAREVLADRCRAITEARWFAVVVFAVVLANAALLGVKTYAGLAAGWHRWSSLAEHACVPAFTIEILLRTAAYADRPRDFVRDP